MTCNRNLLYNITLMHRVINRSKVIMMKIQEIISDIEA